MGNIKVVIPTKLRERALKELKDNNLGASRMKALSRSHIVAESGYYTKRSQ